MTDFKPLRIIRWCFIVLLYGAGNLFFFSRRYIRAYASRSPLIEEKNAMTGQSQVQARGIARQGHRIYEEGMISGVIGAATIALWFFIVDSLQGQLLFTPSVLGYSLLKGEAGLTSFQSIPISIEVVFMFTWIHGLVFVAIGVAGSWLLHLAERDPNYGFGILLLFVLFEFGFICVSLLFSEGVLQALTIPDILIGNLLAATAMGIYFWRKHPGLNFLP